MVSSRPPSPSGAVPLLAPPTHIGMRELDRSQFNQQIDLVAAVVPPRYIASLSKISQPGELLDLRAISRVVFLPGVEDGKKGVLLAIGKDQHSLSEQTRALLNAAAASYVPYTLQVGYEHWSAEEMLRAILPPELGEVPVGFTIVGHIAHLNLRDKFLPYKYIIGQIILDKNKKIRTVVNKLDSIHAVYRTFDMEVIAGDKANFWVEQHESGCRFQFDFEKVYWNSRLHTEHERLVSLFKDGEAVCDPFAGVGPFAVPAGRRGVLVLASDLNPESYRALQHNVELNNVQSLVRAYNEDARAFIRSCMSRLAELRAKEPEISLGTPKRRRENASDKQVSQVPQHRKRSLKVPRVFSHFVMNLPDSAIEFLDAFRGLYASEPAAEAAELPLPMIHVHCFHKHEPGAEDPTPEEVAVALAARISTAMNHPVDPNFLSIHDVRKVSPTKEMYCVSFVLPREVALAES